MNLSPICLFTYNRLAETKKTIEALKGNFLAGESEIYIYSDGWKNMNSKPKVELVRQYLNNIKGFKTITIIEREENFGLAKSIISGVSEIIKEHRKVIVLEDDLITSKNFLSYMNKSLDFYERSNKIWSISGFSFRMEYPQDYIYDVALGIRASSWGWGTWYDRWDRIDWSISDYASFQKDKKAQKKFKAGGSDILKMLNDQQKGKIDSWAIRFCYHQFINQMFDVYPVRSTIVNIGFSQNATNTIGMSKRFKTELDNSNNTSFRFTEEMTVDENILSQFRNRFSIYTRLKYKLLNLLR
jgi:hypothetical protein